MSIEGIIDELDELAPVPEVADTLPRESLEELVSRGVVARELNDGSSWALGDIAYKVERDLGKEAVAVFASQIGLKPDTVRQYRWISSRFPKKEERMTGLSWSHYRNAAGADNPMEWIEMAVDGDWSAEELYARMKEEHEDTRPNRVCPLCEGLMPEGDIGKEIPKLIFGGHTMVFCSLRCLASYVENELNPVDTLLEAVLE